MPIDTSMYSTLAPPKFESPQEVQQKAMSMKMLGLQTQNMQREVDDQQAMRDAYRGNITPGTNGTPTLDRAKFLSQLAQQNPQLAMQKQVEFSKQDSDLAESQMKMLKDRHEQAADIAFSVPTDPNTTPEQKQAAWTQAKQKALAAGLPGADQSPDQYPGDMAVKQMQMHTLSAKEQSDQQWKQKEFDQKQQDLGIKREQLDVDRNEKLAGKLQDHLDKGWTARSGAAGTVQQKLISAEAAQQLIDQGRGQQGGLDSRQIEELAQSTGKLLGGGASASARIDALVPHTFLGRAQSFKEWATNSPSGQDMQAFTDRMAETVAREKALAETQKRQFQIEGLPRFSELKKKDPDKYNSMLQGKGIDSSMIDEKGRYKAPVASGDHPQDSAAVSWAKANPKDPRSTQILQLNGGGN